MQLPEQQASRPGHKGFLPGRSGNPRGRLSAAERRRLVLAKAHALAQPIGGFDALNTIELGVAPARGGFTAAEAARVRAAHSPGQPSFAPLEGRSPPAPSRPER